MIYDLIKNAPVLAEALRAFNDGQTERAADLCTVCIEKDESTPAALLLRSMCSVVRGKMDDAVYDNGRALALLSLSGGEVLSFAQSSVDYGLELGYCASVMEAAGRELETQSELSARSLVSAANAYNCAGIARYRAGSPLEQESGDFEKARDLMLRSRKINAPDDDERLLFAMIDSNLAECCFRGQDQKRCRGLFEEASEELLPDIYKSDIFLQHYSYCRNCLFELDRGEGSNVDAHKKISDLIKVIGRKKGELTEEQKNILAVSYAGRAAVRYQMGNYSGAVSDCTQALQLKDCGKKDDEQLSMIYYSRAEAYEQLNELEKAAGDYERSIGAVEELQEKATYQAVGLRRLMQASCWERLKKYAEAAESYRKAAEMLESGLNDPETAASLPERIDHNTAALCRFRSGKCICCAEDKDYHESFTQQLAAYRIIDSFDENALNIARKAIIADSVSELFELFDEYEEAGKYYRTARELEEQLDPQKKDEILAAVSRMLDPFGNDVSLKYNGTGGGEFSGGAFIFSGGTFVDGAGTDGDTSDAYDEYDEDGYADDKYDDKYDDGYDDEYDDGEYDEYEDGEIIFDSEDSLGGGGEQAAEEQDQLDGDYKIWKDPSDIPPEG